MTLILSLVTAIAAGLAILVAGLILFPNSGMRGLAKGVAIAVALCILAAVLIAATRALGFAPR